jgi:DNA-directed RNA polymerase subunit RPC12/RpoP
MLLCTIMHAYDVTYYISEGTQSPFLSSSQTSSLTTASSQAERLLDRKVNALCEAEGINQLAMLPLQRLFLTHYRCPMCKLLLPLYQLDLSHMKKVRCSRCGQIIPFKSSGKYGKMRKKLATMIWRETIVEAARDNLHC